MLDSIDDEIKRSSTISYRHWHPTTRPTPAAAVVRHTGAANYKPLRNSGAPE